MIKVLLLVYSARQRAVQLPTLFASHVTKMAGSIIDLLTNDL
jgi:hypothetical protein